MKIRMLLLPLLIGVLSVPYGADVIAQEPATAAKLLAQAQAAFDAKNYELSGRLAGEAYAEDGDPMREPGTITARAMLLQGNSYAAAGDYKSAAMSFKVLKMMAKNPVDKAVGTEAGLLVELLAPRCK